ncbi:NADH-quinone oxidoreductase subunit M [Halobacteriovorax sp. GB3]|uniref:complex I subunit 4 family protein n=1 Tax=Halobacteriovorax sp. GB3 TaxID=2719615 RepID=UPI00235E68C8|nr:NADH-quinone oxidoreductase subunit M [Halobacteriovorax sp. GB3]MDD0854701.1 NADH-quinone oxidoreductase subunit M [Halobacteriovorax sp. GB3]
MSGTSNLLNWILWMPIIGVLGILFIPRTKEGAIRVWSLINTVITLVLSLVLYAKFDTTVPGMQQAFSVKIPWISQFNINYYLGVDGISLPMIVLTSLLLAICILSSWTIKKQVKAYFALLLFLQSTVYGVFMALDFFLFYVYWEVMLIPMFFLIGVWGGENREYAAVKFFLYTFFGSILMLVGMVALYFVSGQTESSFDILALSGGHFTKEVVEIFGMAIPFAKLFFVALFIGFAIKVPVFPFHTWLPHAHVQAPTAISVILAGVLLKMGTYGFLRIAFPIFPEASVYFSDAIAWLGLINVIYGAFCAMAQTDVKKLVAYSSVSHMGFVMLGLAAMTVQGMNGAVLQMFNHGTSTAMMFLLIGILYERSHHRWIVRPDGSKGFGGLYTQLPVYSIIFIIAMFASMGLPGLSGFISEALIFLGIYERFTTITVIGVVGLLIGAAYLLWMFKRMFFGEVVEECKSYTDMNAREVFYMIPLCVAVIFFGIFPSPILNVMKASVGKLVSLLAQY